MTEVKSSSFIERFFKNGNKHQPLNMGDTLIGFINEDSVNKIEAQRWQGIDGELKNIALKELLYRSDFKAQRQKAGKILGEDGEVFVALIKLNDEWDISFFRINSYEEVKTRVLDMTAISDGIVKSGGIDYNVYYRWCIAEEGTINPNTQQDISGRVIRQTVWRDALNKRNEKVVEWFVYPPNVKRVPGTIIRNNAESKPDWVNVVRILYEMNLLSNDIGPEWENIKTMWNSIGVFGNGRQAQSRQKQIENGERSFSDFSTNAKAMQGFGTIISGSQTLSELISAVMFMEDRALKYSFQGRDIDGTGTNKHGLQVGLFNQAHAETLTKKKEQRENDFMRFFKDIVEPITGIEAPQKITIWDSPYEQGKKEAMSVIKAQKKMQEAQAVAQRAVAIKQGAEAKKKDVESQKLKKEMTMLDSTPKQPTPIQTETNE